MNQELSKPVSKAVRPRALSARVILATDAVKAGMKCDQVRRRFKIGAGTYCDILRRLGIEKRSGVTIHGHARTGKESGAHKSWGAMIARCHNPNSADYKNYGARGIQVCDRWRTSFVNFFADMGHRPDGYTLERKDHEGNYEPSNCKWATRKEQALNMRRSVIVTHNNLTYTAHQWAALIGISAPAFYTRLRRHGPLWSFFPKRFDSVPNKHRTN